jgi:hypothetical protein
VLTATSVLGVYLSTFGGHLKVLTGHQVEAKQMPLIDRKPEQRRQAKARARSVDIPGYYRPDNWGEAKKGRCKVWNEHGMVFQDAVCHDIIEDRIVGDQIRWIARLTYVPAGKSLHEDDLALLRFPIDPEQEG